MSRFKSYFQNPSANNFKTKENIYASALNSDVLSNIANENISENSDEILIEIASFYNKAKENIKQENLSFLNSLTEDLVSLTINQCITLEEFKTAFEKHNVDFDEISNESFKQVISRFSRSFKDVSSKDFWTKPLSMKKERISLFNKIKEKLLFQKKPEASSFNKHVNKVKNILKNEDFQDRALSSAIVGGSVTASALALAASGKLILDSQKMSIYSPNDVKKIKDIFEGSNKALENIVSYKSIDNFIKNQSRLSPLGIDVVTIEGKIKINYSPMFIPTRKAKGAKELGWNDASLKTSLGYLNKMKEEFTQVDFSKLKDENEFTKLKNDLLVSITNHMLSLIKTLDNTLFKISKVNASDEISEEGFIGKTLRGAYSKIISKQKMRKIDLRADFATLAKATEKTINRGRFPSNKALISYRNKIKNKIMDVEMLHLAKDASAGIAIISSIAYLVLVVSSFTKNPNLKKKCSYKKSDIMNLFDKYRATENIFKKIIESDVDDFSNMKTDLFDISEKNEKLVINSKMNLPEKIKDKNYSECGWSSPQEIKSFLEDYRKNFERITFNKSSKFDIPETPKELDKFKQDLIGDVGTFVISCNKIFSDIMEDFSDDSKEVSKEELDHEDMSMESFLDRANLNFSNLEKGFNGNNLSHGDLWGDLISERFKISTIDAIQIRDLMYEMRTVAEVWQNAIGYGNLSKEFMASHLEKNPRKFLPKNMSISELNKNLESYDIKNLFIEVSEQGFRTNFFNLNFFKKYFNEKIDFKKEELPYKEVSNYSDANWNINIAYEIIDLFKASYNFFDLIVELEISIREGNREFLMESEEGKRFIGAFLNNDGKMTPYGQALKSINSLIIFTFIQAQDYVSEAIKDATIKYN